MHINKTLSDFSQSFNKYSALKYLQKLVSIYCSRLLQHFDSISEWIKYRDSLLEYLNGRLPVPEQANEYPSFVSGVIDLGRELVLEAIDVHFDRGFYIPVHIYRPGKMSAPSPAVIVCHGYGQAKNSQDIVDLCIALASSGITTVAVEYDASGERADRPDVHTDTNNVCAVGQLLGITNIQLRVLNNFAVLNYLKKREDIDVNRIGITGLCQGAIVTWYTAALCKELAAIALICGVTTYESIALEYCNRQGGWTGISPYEFDLLKHADVQHLIASFAPRPLLAQNNIIDVHWPLSGFIKVKNFVENIYKLNNAEGKACFSLEHGPHAYADPFLSNVVTWFLNNL